MLKAQSFPLRKVFFENFAQKVRRHLFPLFLKNKRRISVLEVGAGDGCLLSHFLPLAERVVGLEHSPKFLETAQMKFGIKLIDKNFFHIDESFDLILMSHVFEHFADIDRVAEHLRKILKPKGICFIEVPHSPNPSECSTEILEQYVNTTHMFNFTPLALSSFFERKNFIVQKVARFFYRIPEGLDHRTQKAVGRLFLEGGGVTLETLFPAVRYVVTHIFDKKNSFKEVNLNGPFQGFGDNIRVVVSPKDDLQVR